MANDLVKMRPDALLATARSSLECFGYAVLPGFEVAPHHALIIDKVERLLRGKVKKLAIICPPRHGKSTIASILLPAYYLGRNPGNSVICASYGSDLSEGWGRRVRNIVSSPLFHSIFPNCRLSPDSSAVGRFDTTFGGTYIATGRGGPLTGRGANLMVLDDLIKDAEEAKSDVVCKSVIDWLAHVAFTRMHRDARVIAISTRWSERDPMGWILREQQGWEVLHLPAISEGGDDPLGRPLGAPLWESQFPLPALQSIRAAVGAQVWQCLYQGNPKAALGSIFQRQWFRRYTQPPTSFQKIIQSWDTAFKTGASNDYSVCSTWGSTESGFYLLSLWRDKVEFPELKKQVKLQAEQWKPHAILVEDKASGQSLVQELKTATTFPVLPVKVDKDKESRASAITAFFEAGKVHFPEGAAWLSDVEDELAGFPGDVHDDIVDSTSQALNYLRGSTGILGLIEWMRNIASGLLTSAGETKPMPEPQRPTQSDDPLGRQVALQFQMKLAGVKPAGLADEVIPPCPLCQGPRIFLNGTVHCNGCAATFANSTDVEPTSIVREAGPCCSSPLRQRIPGGWRCAQCGAQSNLNQPTNGAPRSQLETYSGRAKMNSGAFRQAFARLFGSGGR